jgi:hypothetical protein
VRERERERRERARAHLAHAHELPARLFERLHVLGQVPPHRSEARLRQHPAAAAAAVGARRAEVGGPAEPANDGGVERRADVARVAVATAEGEPLRLRAGAAGGGGALGVAAADALQAALELLELLVEAGGHLLLGIARLRRGALRARGGRGRGAVAGAVDVEGAAAAGRGVGWLEGLLAVLRLLAEEGDVEELAGGALLEGEGQERVFHSQDFVGHVADFSTLQAAARSARTPAICICELMEGGQPELAIHQQPQGYLQYLLFHSMLLDGLVPVQESAVII